ncbi:hypothetical protein AS888_05025 [Peribacillus simplex]|uniref:AroM family protein n=1 Tax=Peribacillus simplex TaxID=1478 RepID=A0A109N1Q2_9BACI|nr:AroM family protein [Peribacillus simplex]KWW21853.1 hypothetical protein AS888_05025 [Peribacillus simplex]
MTKKSIGVLTIGQSPRVDITPSIQHVLGKTVEIVEVGGLDRIREEDLYSITPDKGEVTYISKLRNGQSIKMGKSKLLPLLQAELNELEERVSVVIMLCTGDFPTIRSNRPMIYPDKIVSNIVQSLLRTGKLGLVVPLEEQRNTLIQKWKLKGVEYCVEVASPYENSDISGAAKKLKNQGAELIVLDCMGYDETHKKAAIEGSGLPILLPRTLIARIVAEYVG